MSRAPVTKVKLTKSLVDAITPVPGAIVDRFDTEVRGFHVRVFPSGRKVFAFRYRDPAGGKPPKYHRLTIGDYGPLTPDQARDVARRHRTAVDQDENPARERQARRDAMTVDEAMGAFLEHLATERSTRHAAETRRLLEAHIAPPKGGRLRYGKTPTEAPKSRPKPERGATENWGPRPVASITRADVVGVHRALKDTPVLANRVMAALSALFAFAQGWLGSAALPTNPVEPMPRYKERRRGRVLSDADAARLGTALRELEKADALPWQGIQLVRLLFLTGMRRSEATRLRWAEVDLKRGRLVLGDSKTGESVRPLGAPAVELLAALPRDRRSPYVFPSLTSPARPYALLGEQWPTIRTAAKLEGLRLHDLRHDTATEAGMRYPAAVLMAITGHTTLATASRYTHQHEDPTKRAADAVAQARAAKLAGTKPAEPNADAAVRPLRGRARGRKASGTG